MSSANSLPANEIRKPVVAGQFYTDNPEALSSQIDGFLEKARQEELPGEVLALIAPHAGYMYSGQVAASAYRQIQGQSFRTVIVIAPSHRFPFNGASVYHRGGYETPLGVIPVNIQMAQTILERGAQLNFYPQAHAMEHSLEVQLPFLQRALGDFQLVPIVMGDQGLSACQTLAEAVSSPMGEEKALLVASSDLSHFHPYDQAVDLDKVILEAVDAFDPQRLHQALRGGRSEACGGGPMVAVMLAAKKLGASGAKVLAYSNSGDVTGDRGSVVGYMAAAIFGSGRSASIS
jgi:AmmeMemoRadiSam system protein B